jgi:hypothetical protein
VGSFLEQFNDPGLQVDMLWTPEQEARRQYRRLSEQAIMLEATAEVPRRLQGASGPELAADKTVTRKARGRTLTFRQQWERDADYDDFLEQAKPNVAELKARGAQIEWRDWWADTKTHLQAELRRIATHALRTGHIKTGNRFCNRLINELAQLEAVMPKHVENA